MGEGASDGLLSSVSMVMLYPAKIRDDIPVRGNCEAAGGSLFLYRDRLEFRIQKGLGLIGGPAVRYAKQSIPQTFLLDEDVQRAQVDLFYIRGKEYNTLTLVLTDGKTWLFAPGKAHSGKSDTAEEMRRLCCRFKMIYGSWIPAPDLSGLYQEVVKAGKIVQQFEQVSQGEKGKSLPERVRKAQKRLREFPEQTFALSLPADPAQPRRMIDLSLNFAFSCRLQLPGIREKRKIQFILNRQTWTVYDSFRAAEREKLSGNCRIMQDAFGRKALELSEEVPIFDSEDAQWDSRRCRYLFTDGEDVHLLSTGGGYRIAYAAVYVHLQSAPSQLYPWLQKLNFPTDRIRWVE